MIDKIIKPVKYYEGLNGLRAICVILVLIFHSNIPFIGKYMGWMGVDFFFVISGFLITGILMDSKTKKNYFKNFYVRRFLRIFPIYYLVVISLFFSIFVFLFFTKKTYDLSSFPAYLLYLQNIYAVLHNGFYFPLLGHTWSLAVEEQFYLFWPFIVFFFSNKKLFWIALSLILIAPILRMYYSLNDFHIFYQNSLLHTRFDALAMGGGVAIIIRNYDISMKKIKFISSLLLYLGLTSFMFLIYSIGNDLGGSFLDGWYSLRGNKWQSVAYGHMLLTPIAMIATAILIKVVFKTSNFFVFITSFLERKTISYVGIISYGIYLYHYPIFSIVEKGFTFLGISLNSFILFFIQVALTLFVAALSWKYFEKWFVNKKEVFAKYN